MPWSDLAFLFGAGLVAAVVSALGTTWAVGHARRHGLVDVPGERRSHQVTTPRGGGIGIVIACLICLIAMVWQGIDHSGWLLIAAGFVSVSGIGWFDDHRSLPALPRLGVHVLAASLLAAFLHLGGAGSVICMMGFALAMVLINVWNFMDGINGLATSQALLCGMTLALLPGFTAPVLGVVLAGACLGFLPFNFPHARIFMGDVGSGALGYLLAVLIAIAFTSSSAQDWPLLLLAPLAMLMDSGLTLLWRLYRGDRWWQPHTEHAYQRWSRHRGHVRVTLAYGLWTTTVIAVMLSVWARPGNTGLTAFLTCVTVAVLGWWWLHRRYAGKTEGFGT